MFAQLSLAADPRARLKIRVRPAPQLRCPFCHDTVEVADARICPACSSAQHAACDEAHGGCAVCVVYSKRRAPRARRPRRRWGRGPGGHLWSALRYLGWSVGLFFATVLGLIGAGLLAAFALDPWTAIPILVSLVSACGSLICFLCAAAEGLRAAASALTRALSQTGSRSP